MRFKLLISLTISAVIILYLVIWILQKKEISRLFFNLNRDIWAFKPQMKWTFDYISNIY